MERIEGERGNKTEGWGGDGNSATLFQFLHFFVFSYSSCVINHHNVVFIRSFTSTSTQNISVGVRTNVSPLRSLLVNATITERSP